MKMTGVCRDASSRSSRSGNPLSGGELFWIHLDLDRIKLEVLVNQRALRGELAWARRSMRKFGFRDT